MRCDCTIYSLIVEDVTRLCNVNIGEHIEYPKSDFSELESLNSFVFIHEKWTNLSIRCDYTSPCVTSLFAIISPSLLPRMLSRVFITI